MGHLAEDGHAGFHGTPNLTRYGKASVLDDLKYHYDLTEEAVSSGNGGVPSSEIHFNVYWFVDQNNNIWAAGNGDDYTVKRPGLTGNNSDWTYDQDYGYAFCIEHGVPITDKTSYKGSANESHGDKWAAMSASQRKLIQLALTYG